MMPALKNRLNELVHELDCIEYGTRVLSSGGKSNYKINCDALIENPESRIILAKMGSETLLSIDKNREYEIVGIMGGGYNFGRVVAGYMGREIVGVNPHDGLVYGRVKKPCVCWFEDVVTKGQSILKCRSILKKPNLKDNYAVSIADREEGGRETLLENGIELRSIFTKRELGINQS